MAEATLLYLENRSFSSCSEQNGPKFATKRVVQGPLLLLLFTKAAEVEWLAVAVEPAGLPSMGLAAAMCGWGGKAPVGVTAAGCAAIVREWCTYVANTAGCQPTTKVTRGGAGRITI